MEQDKMERLKAICALEVRLDEAREKHPIFAKGKEGALYVIGDEFRELRVAVDHESRERQISEALDVAATCLRFVMGEHLQ